MNRISTVVSIQPIGDLVLITMMDGAKLAIPPSELYHSNIREHDAMMYSEDDMTLPIKKVHLRG